MGREIVYCDVCGVQIPGEDFARQRALAVNGKNYCAKCKAKAPAPAAAVATPARSDATRKPSSRGPGIGTVTPHPQMRRPPSDIHRPPTTARVIPVAPKKNRTPLLIGAGIGVLVIIGALVYLATKRAAVEPDKGPAHNGAGAGGPNTPPTPPTPPTQELRPGEAYYKQALACWADCKSGKHSPTVCRDLLKGLFPKIERTAFEQDAGNLQHDIEVACKREEILTHLKLKLDELDGIIKNVDLQNLPALKNGLEEAYQIVAEMPELKARVDMKKADFGKRIIDKLPAKAQEIRDKIASEIREGSKYGAKTAVTDFLEALTEVEFFGALPAGLREEFKKKDAEIDELIKKEEGSATPPDRPHDTPTPDTPAKFPEDPPPPAGKFTSLMNGKDDKGWFLMTKGGGSWSVENGAFIGEGGGASGDQFGAIIATAITGLADQEVVIDIEVEKGKVGLCVRGDVVKGNVDAVLVPIGTAGGRKEVTLRIVGDTLTVKSPAVKNPQEEKISAERPPRGRVMLALSGDAKVKIHSLKVKPIK